MPAPARFWLVVVRRIAGRAYARSRAQLIAVALTLIAASLVLPGPWDVSRAEAAKAAPVREVVELRSARSKTIRQPDGSFETTLSEQSLHYFDEARKAWKEIDASFKDSTKKDAKWESGENRFGVELAGTSKDEFLTLRTPDGSFSLSLEGAASASGVKAKENSVTFKDAFEDVDVEYVLLPDGLKENIVLREPGAPSEYRFRFDPQDGKRWRAEEREDGVWFFGESASEPAFVLVDPVVGDSKGQALPQPDSAVQAPSSWSPAPGKASMDVDAQDDGSFVVTLEINGDWLSSEDRVYPVVLDPTWVVHPDFADGEYDTTNGGLPNVSTSTIRTGRAGAGSAKYASVMSFDFGALPGGVKLLDARLNAFLEGCTPAPCGTDYTGDVELRRLGSGWSAATPWSAVTVDPALQDKITFGTTPTLTWQRWASATFTQTLQAMANGTLANHGFVLQKAGGNDNVGYSWRSARWSDPSFAPYLEIYWIADGVQLSPATHLHANGAELSWQHFAGGTSAYADAVFQDSPVGYWRLDEGAGDTMAWDWSGNDLTGEFQNTNGLTRAQQGALADGNYSTRIVSNAHARVTDEPVLDVGNTFTIEAWVGRAEVDPYYHTIVGKGPQGFVLRMNPTGKLELLHSHVAVLATSTGSITDVAWHHVAVTKSGGTITFYIDGAPSGTTSGAGNVSDTAKPLLLGIEEWSDGTFNVPWTGLLDEVAIYPTALAATRLQAHYSAAQIPMPLFRRFEIHRGTIPGFTASASTLVGTVADASIQHFRDSSAKPASTFYYRVITVTDEGSFSSNELKTDLPAQGQGQVTIQPGLLASGGSATHIWAGNPSGNAGDSQGVIVSSLGDNHTRALLSLDLRLIPTGATISSAKLELYALQTTPALNLHRVTAVWTEAWATWASRDQGTAWQNAGGDFEPSPTSSSAGGSHQHWDSWEIGPLVQQWMNGTTAPQGVLLKYGSENGSQPMLVYASDEYSRSIALRPKLVITYADGSQAVSPTVAVSQPSAGEVVKGTMTVKAGALDDGNVAQVQFFLDGNALGAPDTAAPFEVSWNTTSASRGEHTLTAKATDEAGNQTTSQGVTVTVVNSASPTTSVTDATAGAGGVWTVNASASDDVGIGKVEFYVDGDRFATDSSSPYSATLPTLTFPAYDGPRTITTRAYDADGNVTTSAAHPITVANTAGTIFKATISTSNVPLELRHDPGAGPQEGAPLTVSLTNTSASNWPTASTKLRYRWFTADSPPVATDSANVSIGADLGAGQQRNVALTVDPPALPTGVYRARYLLRIDLYDTAASTYFAAKGNRPFETWVTVTRKVLDEMGLERYQQYDGEDLGGGFDHALNLANGNNVVQWVPFSQPGRGLNTVVTLTYNSLEHGSVSPLGNNWSLAISSLAPFGLPLDIHPNAADTAAGRTQKWVGFTDGDGSYHVFTGNGAGTYYAAPAGVHLYLKQTAGGWELWKPDRTKFVFSTAGFPSSVEDANGNALTYTLATPAAGEDAYGLAKRVTTVTDAGGRAFTLTYFSKAETPTPAMRGKLKKVVDHVGHALELTYYEDGNLRSIREKGGPGDDGMPTPDREVFLNYTTPAGGGPAIGTLAGRKNPDPATVQSPKLYSVIDFRGNETAFAYSTAADAKKWRLSTRTNRAGSQTSFAYDTTARTTTATMPLSRIWTYSFDSEGRVTQIDDPVNSAHTTVEWADAQTANEVTNTVRKVTQPSGEFTEYAYNDNGYKTDEWDELRNRQTFEYENIAVDANDVASNWVSGGSAGVPTFVGAGPGAAVTGVSGTVQKTSCTAGNLVVLQTVIDGTGGFLYLSNVTNIEKLDGTDADMNHPSTIQLGSTVQARADLWLGRVIANGTCSVTMQATAGGDDMFGRMYEFAGEAAGSAVADVLEEGALAFDASAGSGTTIGDESVTTTGPDRLAVNLVQVNDDLALPAFAGETGGDWTEPVAEFASATGTQAALGIQTAPLASAGTINGGALTLSASAHWGTWGFAIKPAAGGGSSSTRSIPHLSQLTAVVKPRGNATSGDPNDYRWRFTYTPSGLVDTILDPPGNVTDNAWNANGTLASQTLPANGDGITRTTTFNSYDANGLPTQVTDAAGGVTKAGYAPNGSLLWLQDPNHGSYSGGTPSEYRQEHLYDAHGRPVRSSQPKSTAFTPGLLAWQGTTHDPNDNELTTVAAHYGRGDGGNGAVTTTSYDAMDRPTLVTGPRSAAEGGPVKTETEYDAAGRVTKVTKPKGVNSAPSGSAWTKDHVTETVYDLLDREQKVTAYAVDGSGLVDDAATRITNHCYDDAGDLRSLTGPKGAAGFTSCPNPAANPYVYTSASHTTKFEYDDAHRQLKQTDALGRITETAYDENGQVTSETDEASKVTQTFYDDRGLKTKLVEPFDTGRTLTTIWENDPLGNLKRLISPRAFDAANGPGQYTNYVESYAYDALGRKVKTMLPTGPGVNTYFGTALADSPVAYWRFGGSGGDEISPPANATMSGAVGQAGALEGDPDGSVTCPGDWTCASITGENAGKLNVWTSLSVEAWVKTASTANQTIIGNNSHGYKLWMSGGGVGFKVTVDAQGNAPAVSGGSGYANGEWHHVAGTYERESGTLSIYVDGTQVAQQSFGAGSIWYTTSEFRIGGDVGGNYLTGSLDELAIYGSALSEARIDAHFEARSPQQSAQAYTHSAYDANGNALWTSLPTIASTPATVTAQERTTLSYWDTGAIYASQDQENPKVRFDYTAEGWQSLRIPEHVGIPGSLNYGQTMAWQYLPDGLLRAHVDQQSQRALYAYDANGNRTQALEATGIVSAGQTPLQVDLSYNSQDELTKVRNPKPGAAGTYLATTLAYDLHGNTSELVDNREESGAGQQTAAGRSFTYTYNAADQAISQLDDFGTAGAPADDELLSYSYATTGELSQQALQKWNSGSWADEQYSQRTYFDNGLLKTLRSYNGQSTLIEEHTLSYLRDGIYLNGNRASDGFFLKGPNAACNNDVCTASWVYDARERLVRETQGGGPTALFTLDVQGNVTHEITAGQPGITRTYEGQKLATQTQSGIQTRFLYDSFGNLDCKVRSEHTGTSCPAGGDANLIEDNVYDYRNRLAGFRYYNGAQTASKVVDYTNDPLDRPVKQAETISGEATSYDFTYVGVTNALSKEVLTGATNTTKRYAYDAFGNRATISEGENRYSYLYDPHGSVSLLIDQNSTIKESYGYSAYGVANAALTKTAAGFNPKTNPYRYTGKRLDTGSGTYDMGARRYSASTGRFLQYDVFYDALDDFSLSQDPLTQNRYALAGANPVTFVEMDGHRAGTALVVYDSGGTQFATCGGFADCHDLAPPSLGEVLEGLTSLPASPIGLVKLIGRQAAKQVARVVSRYFGKEAGQNIRVQNPALRNLVKALFRPQNTRPGGTAGELKREIRRGDPDPRHLQKAQENESRLRKILNEDFGPLNKTDRRVAKALLKDLRSALREARLRGYGT